MSQLFNQLTHDGTSLNEYAKSIENVLTETAERLRKTGNRVRNVPQVIVKTISDDTIDEINIDTLDYDQIMKREFEFIYNALGSEIPEPLQQLICSRLNSMIFSQSMRPLIDYQLGIDYVRIPTNSETYPNMYFYTEHETQGNYEIWYKALDPFVWYGTPEK